MSYKKYLADLSKMSREYGKALTKEMAAFKAMHDDALVPGVLDTKTKELIALGISVNIRCEPCIVSHVYSLVELGATREEIIETLGVSLFMGGGPATAYGAKALAVYDELTKE